VEGAAALTSSTSRPTGRRRIAQVRGEAEQVLQHNCCRTGQAD
jgi:hypothetical protein